MQPERDEWELRWAAFEAAKADWEAHDTDVALAARVAAALTVPAPVLFINTSNSTSFLIPVPVLVMILEVDADASIAQLKPCTRPLVHQYWQY